MAAKEGTVAHELCECKLRGLLGEDVEEASTGKCKKGKYLTGMGKDRKNEVSAE